MRRSGGAIAAAVLMLCVIPQAAFAQNEDLERRRLDLDIQRLQDASGWEADVQGWLPACSVLVAAAVAFYGVWRYFDERRRATDTQVKEGVAHNLERLVDAPAERATSNARSTAALRSLNALAPTDSDETAEQRRSDVTKVLTALVRNDLSLFRTAEDARLPVIYADNWDEFRELVANDKGLCREVGGRYLDQLREINARAPLYLSSVRRGNGDYVNEKGTISDSDAPLFRAVVAGFERYVGMMPPGGDRDAAITAFREMAPKLGVQLFGELD